MCDWHDYSDSDKDASDNMDELLCEYVDGTMDPAVRRVFEEFLSSNPDFALHVDELKRTRALLCTYRCRMNAPFGIGGRLHREVTDEMMRAQSPLFSLTSQRLRQATSLTSMVVAMMMVGLVSGSLLVDEQSVGVTSTSAQAVQEDVVPQAVDRAPVHPRINQSGFGAFSTTMSAPAVESQLVVSDTQIVRSFEFESLREIAVATP